MLWMNPMKIYTCTLLVFVVKNICTQAKCISETAKEFENNCYELFRTPLPWTEAQEYCMRFNGKRSLAKVGSHLVLSFLHSLKPGRIREAWLGATDKLQEGKWVWTDGTKVDLTSMWSYNEPNNFLRDEHCLETNGYGKLNDFHCYESRSFICMEIHETSQKFETTPLTTKTNPSTNITNPSTITTTPSTITTTPSIVTTTPSIVTTTPSTITTTRSTITTTPSRISTTVSTITTTPSTITTTASLITTTPSIITTTTSTITMTAPTITTTTSAITKTPSTNLISSPTASATEVNRDNNVTKTETFSNYTLDLTSQQLTVIDEKESNDKFMQPTLVAFTVGLSKPLDILLQDVIVYNKVVSNIGDDYNNSTGVFRCNMAGLYFFQIHGAAGKGKELSLSLVKNKKKVISLYRSKNQELFLAANSAVLLLEAGDEVFVEASNCGSLYGEEHHVINTFSGFLMDASIAKA